MMSALVAVTVTVKADYAIYFYAETSCLSMRLFVSLMFTKEHASCGAGCSGNPFDMEGGMNPIGWLEGHELGHNMQMSLLQIAWVPSSSSADVWTNYQNRAVENSNEIFPFYNQWRWYRKVKKYNASVPAFWGWASFTYGHRNSYSVIQSALAKKNATVNGVKSRVSLKEVTCAIKNSFPLTTSASQVLAS